MNEGLILAQLHKLPENLKVEVLHYISFLRSQQREELTKKVHKRRFGSAKGKYRLAPDFNAPLADFNEYM